MSTPSSGQNRHGRGLYLVVTAVVVVVIVVAGYALTGGFQSSHGGPLVLAHAGTYYTIPGGQFDGITFIISATSIINGTFSTSWGIVLYEMNSTQFLSYSKTNILPSYEWTSGWIANATVYNLDLTVSPGSWALVFVNPSPVNTTAIGFYTDLTLASA